MSDAIDSILADKAKAEAAEPAPDDTLTRERKLGIMSRLGWNPPNEVIDKEMKSVPSDALNQFVKRGERNTPEKLRGVTRLYMAEREFSKTFPGARTEKQMQPLIDFVDVTEANHMLATGAPAVKEAARAAGFDTASGKMTPQAARAIMARYNEANRREDLKAVGKDRLRLFINSIFAEVVPGGEGVFTDKTKRRMSLEQETRGGLGNVVSAGVGLSAAIPQIKVLQGGMMRTAVGMGLTQRNARMLTSATSLGILSVAHGGKFGEGFTFGFLTPGLSSKIADALKMMPLRAQASVGEALSFAGVGASIHGFDAERFVTDMLVGATAGGASGKQGLILRRLKAAHGKYQNAKTAFERTAASEEVRGLVGQMRGSGGAANPPTPGSRTSAEAGFVSPFSKKSPIRDQAKAVALQRDRRLRAMVDRTGVRVKEWNKQLPNRDAMEDVGALIEKGGNVRTGESFDDVLKRASPAVKKVAREMGVEYERLRQELNRIAAPTTEGDYFNHLEDYLTHFYVGSKRTIRGAANRLMKNSPNAKKRRYPTLEEASKPVSEGGGGLTPKTQNAGEILSRYTELNARVVLNRRMLHELIQKPGPKGSPLVIPRSAVGDGRAPEGYVEYSNEAINKMQLFGRQKSGGTERLFFGEGPMLVHEEALPYVKAMLERPWSNKGVAAWQAVNALAKSSQLSFSIFHDVTLRGSANASLAFAPGTGIGRFNPIRGIVKFFEVDPSTGTRLIVTTPGRAGKRLLESGTKAQSAAKVREGMIEHGLTIGGPPIDARIALLDRMFGRMGDKAREWEANAHGLKKAPAWAWARTAGLIDSFRKGRQEMLWGYHENVKAITYHEATERFLRNAPPGENGENHTRIKETVAKFVNDAYGGQEWMNTMLAHPKVRQAVHGLVFAPDWTWSNIAVALPGLKSSSGAILKAGDAPKNVRRMMHNAYWRNSLITYGMSAVGMQAAVYSAFGDPEKGDKRYPWENESGKQFFPDMTPLYRAVSESFISDLPIVGGVFSDDETALKLREGRRIYVKPGKQMQEPVRYFTEPFEMIYSKSAPIVRQAMAQLTGSEGGSYVTDFAREEARRGNTEWLARARHAASDFLPFAVRGNQFMLSLPARMGPSQFKVEQSMALMIDDFVRKKGSGPVELVEKFVQAKMRGLKSEGEKFRHSDIEAFRDEVLSDFIADIAASAKRNGHDPARAVRSALGSVRGSNMGALIKATQLGRKSEMEEEARVFHRLQGTVGRIKRSLEARGKQFTAEEMRSLMDALRSTGPDPDEDSR